MLTLITGDYFELKFIEKEIMKNKYNQDAI